MNSIGETMKTDFPGALTETTDFPVIRRAVEFVLLTFTISFGIWIPIIASHRGWIGLSIPASLAPLGIFGPVVAALILTLSTEGYEGLREIKAKTTRWRYGRRWWAATLFIPPILIGGMYGAYLLLGGVSQRSAMMQMLQDAGASAAIVVPVLVLVTILLSFGEEAGWRGYLLPVLQTRLNALAASLVLGVVWFLWHIPLAYLPGQAEGQFPLLLWGTTITLTSVLYTWLYNNTRGSLLSVTLLHAGLNVWGPLVALHPDETGDPLSAYIMVGGYGIVAIILILAFGGATLVNPKSTTPTFN